MKIRPYSWFTAFSPRRKLAPLEIKMAVSIIRRHFDVLRTEPDKNIEERFVFTMMPQDLMISLRPREVTVTYVDVGDM
jgi:hypothetical protein